MESVDTKSNTHVVVVVVAALLVLAMARALDRVLDLVKELRCKKGDKGKVGGWRGRGRRRWGTGSPWREEMGMGWESMEGKETLTPDIVACCLKWMGGKRKRVRVRDRVRE